MSSETVQHLKELQFLFSQFGLPECIVSDNGTCVTSSEFDEFLKKLGIKNIVSAPYHPASNGLAEQAVHSGIARISEKGGLIKVGLNLGVLSILNLVGV